MFGAHIARAEFCFLAARRKYDDVSQGAAANGGGLSRLLHALAAAVAELRHRARMSQFYKGTIPKWRLLFWVLIAMAGVAYFARPNSESQRYLLWGVILFTGIVIGGFGLVLNWTRTERARAWVREHPRLVRTMFAMAVLITALLKLMDIVFHK